jgi:dihydrofolate reductase
MSKVILGMTMSVDGIAGGELDPDGWAIHESIMKWVYNLASWREQQGQDGGEDSLDSRIWAQEFARFGAQVLGRGMFDVGEEYWGDNPPFHAPIFVVTHRGGETIQKLGGTSYSFCPDVKDAIERARAAADGKDVLVAGGVSTAQQALAAGLVDELFLHVSPVLIGRGKHLFATEANLRLVEAIPGDNALHLRYVLA